MSPLRPKPIVRDRMTYPVMCALSTDRLTDVYALMTDRRIRHLPVLHQGRLIGIVSDRDLLLYGTKKSGCLVLPPNLRAGDIMSPEIVACHPETPIEEAAARMLDLKLDALPVIDKEQHLVGVITSSDMMELVRDQTGEEAPLGSSRMGRDVSPS